MRNVNAFERVVAAIKIILASSFFPSLFFISSLLCIPVGCKGRLNFPCRAIAPFGVGSSCCTLCTYGLPPDSRILLYRTSIRQIGSFFSFLALSPLLFILSCPSFLLVPPSVANSSSYRESSSSSSYRCTRKDYPQGKATCFRLPLDRSLSRLICRWRRRRGRSTDIPDTRVACN